MTADLCRIVVFFFFSSRRRHTRCSRDWSSDVCSSDLAIDVASRPYGKSAWAGKPCGVVSVSPGAVGGFGANHHLRQMLVFLDMPALRSEERRVGKEGRSRWSPYH